MYYYRVFRDKNVQLEKVGGDTKRSEVNLVASSFDGGLVGGWGINIDLVIYNIYSCLFCVMFFSDLKRIEDIMELPKYKKSLSF